MFLQIIYLVLASIIILAGVLGVIFPILPGVPLIFAGILFYALVTHFTVVTPVLLIWLGVFTLISLIFDYLSRFWGAKRFGASKWGIAGLILGLIVGIVVGGPVGLILGPLLGAIVFELISGRQIREALKVGWGSFLGFVLGTFFNLILAIVMLILFFQAVF